jgi:hypothetical protein
MIELSIATDNTSNFGDERVRKASASRPAARLTAATMRTTTREGSAWN